MSSSRPWSAFAQYYSDNLATEDEEGQGRAQGAGPVQRRAALRGEERTRRFARCLSPDTYPGLLLAFQLAAEGKSDREVADALNAAGYRTTGNRGRNPFTKDTVCRMLKNRFYLGELPDGEGGWLPGAHHAVLDPNLFEQAQKMRAANRTNSAEVNHRHRRYSLSGLAICGHCGGPLHFQTSKRRASPGVLLPGTTGRQVRPTVGLPGRG